MDKRQTALAFVEAINRHDTVAIFALMADDHVFVDTHNHRESAEDMFTGWPGYFAWFPDYHIVVTDIFENDEAVVLWGFASGTYSKKETGGHWRLPAAWKVEAVNGRVKLWQVICDSKIPYECMEET